MGTLSIIGLIFSVIMSGAGIAAQYAANKENVQLAHENREDEQAFAHEEAEIARQANIEQYNQLYSPQAKVQQYEAAGLSPALMYGNGAAQGASGVTTQMANTPSHAAPYINPLLNLNSQNPVTSAIENLKEIQETKRTKAETKNIEENTKLVAQKITESQKLVEKMESEINCNVVTSENEKLKKQLIENEIKISNATIDDQIELVKQNVKLIQASEEKIKKEIDILKIEEGKKAEYLQASINLMNAEKMKYAAETILAGAETALTRMKTKLTQTEINLNIQQRKHLMQEIEKNEIELNKLRNNPLWSEHGMDRVTGLAMSLGENVSDLWKEFTNTAGEIEKEIGKKAYKAMDNWWEDVSYKAKEAWNGNWVPYVDGWLGIKR